MCKARLIAPRHAGATTCDAPHSFTPKVVTGALAQAQSVERFDASSLSELGCGQRRLPMFGGGIELRSATDCPAIASSAFFLLDYSANLFPARGATVHRSQCFAA